MCWTHWLHFKQQEDIHRRHEEANANFSEYQRQMELHLREQQRLRDIRDTNNKEKKLSVMMKMGLKSNRAIEMKMFLIWSGIFKKEQQQRLHEIENNKGLSKIALYLEDKHAKSSSKEIKLTYFQEWVRDTHHSRFERKHMDLEAQKCMVEQLSQERLALAEQLTIVYQQLDAVTDTLQKELKTKEGLAKELREANEQIFHSNLGGNLHIDIASIISSRPATPMGSRPVSPMTSRTSVDAPIASSSKRLTLDDKNDKGTFAERTLTPRAGTTFTERTLTPRAGTPRLRDIYEKPVKASPRDSAAKSPSNVSAETIKFSRGASPHGVTKSVLSPDSSVTSACTWNTALPRMREKGLLHEARC